MLKKITEPQAIYQKAGTPGQPASPSFTTPPKSKGKFSWKIAGSIIAVFLVAVVGIAGVLIAQRQQQVEGPVAPNAPESRPEAAPAAIEPAQCSLSFEIKSAPVTGRITCLSKTANLVTLPPKEPNLPQRKGIITRTPLTANTKVKKGDFLEYVITVRRPATLPSNGNFTIKDTIPAHLAYLPLSVLIDGAQPSSNDPVTNNVLDHTFQMANNPAGKDSKITYLVQVKQDAPATPFTNAVTLITPSNPSNPDTSCKFTLAMESAPTGTASCTTKKAYKADGVTVLGANALVKRGETITYELTIRADKETSGAVVAKDTLPTAVDYVDQSVRINGAAPGNKFSRTGNILTFTLGSMATGANQTTNKEYKITYKAKVKADAAVAAFSNSVAVTTGTKAAPTPAACKATLQVAPVGVATCTSKEAFTDYTGTKLTKDATVQKGSTFTYKLTVGATQTTAGAVTVVDTLPAHLEFVESKGGTLTHANGKLTANIQTMGGTPATQTKIFEYKVKVKDTAAAGAFENAVTVTTAGVTSPADTCKLALQVPYQCNADCTTDAQCSSANAGYICSVEAGNKCRLASNQSSATCGGAGTSYSCNSSCTADSQCQGVNADYVCAPTSEGQRCRHKNAPTNASCTVASTPTPTPAIGCNESCASNADCTNPSHICYTTSDGSQLCRLDTNPASASCSTPGGSVSTPIPTTELPEELPVTGPEDWVNWLKAGLITLGIGAVLLLLL